MGNLGEKKCATYAAQIDSFIFWCPVISVVPEKKNAKA